MWCVGCYLASIGKKVEIHTWNIFTSSIWTERELGGLHPLIYFKSHNRENETLLKWKLFCLEPHFLSALGTGEAETEQEQGEKEKWSDGKRHGEKDTAQKEDPPEETEIDTRNKKAKIQPSTQENRHRDTDPEIGIHNKRTRGKGL